MKFLVFAVVLLMLTLADCRVRRVRSNMPRRISLTISAKINNIEISWYNLTPKEGVILLTNAKPTKPYRKYISPPNTKTKKKSVTWTYGPYNKTAQYWVEPTERSGWITTSIPFNFDILDKVTLNTTCYGFWAVYLDANGDETASACLSAYPSWMNDMREEIGGLKIRDLFLPGTHDAGAYKDTFDPEKNETLITEYVLTQDDDIFGQMLHGARYLDIRIANYPHTKQKFWINHGIYRLHPLTDILKQVRDFVTKTNEIVIFDIQGWPVGFEKNETHRILIQLLVKEIGEIVIDPKLLLSSSLNDIWKTKKNVFLGYDNSAFVSEFPSYLTNSFARRWGDVQTVPKLKSYLSPFGKNLSQILPIVDKAELTPDLLHELLDLLDGLDSLREMADETNRQVSQWYYEEWGPMANIISVDFMRGTNLMESCFYWNSQKGI